MLDLPAKPIHILLVDDNPNNLKVLSEAMQGYGWKALMATDGEMAIAQAEYAKPDLILLDVMMPGIDGFETCRRLKANPTLQNIPVIFMTALSDTTDKVKGLELGAVDYITKPFQQAEVIARLKLHLKIAQFTHTLEERVKERTAELEQSLQELSASEARFHKLSNNIPGVIYQIRIHPSDGISEISYISSGCYALYEVTAQEMMAGSYSLRDFEHPDDRFRIDQAIHKSAEHLIPLRQEFRIVTPSGQVKWVQVASQPEQQADGWVLWDGVAIDISERARLEAERKQAETALVESEAKFRRLVEGANDMIWSAQADGTLTYLSPQFQTMFGFPPSEWIGQSFTPLIHPDDLERIMASARSVIERGEMQQNTEFRHLCQDGRYLWVTVNVTSIKDAAGKSVGMQGIVRDISDRKIAEEQLQYQAEQLKHANQQLAEYSQTLEQRVAERTAELSQALANLQATQQELIQSEKMAALGQLTASVAHEINTPLGVIRGATSNIVAAFQASLQHLPSILQRLSSQQQADFLALVQAALQSPQSLSTKEERQLRQHLETKLSTQGISHASKIASHLTLLRLGANLQPYLSLLQDPNCEPILQAAYHLVVQQQSTQSIQQEVDRAAKIVFALKTYSYQNNAGEKSLISITDGIEVALTLYQNRLKQGIEVIRSYREVPQILCNPDELTQVWVNLIDNAIYAMGHQGNLEISVTHQTDWIVVEVTDSGCGIPIALQAHIFEPFVTTKPRGEGSGLGLDIVQQIMQKHQGEIQVTSQPGRTSFTVRLPLQT